MKKANTVIACDADLSYLTVATIGSARNGEMPAQFYVNRNKKKGQQIEIYNNENQLHAELLAAVRKGGPYYVCCNSKKKAEMIVKSLRQSVERELKIKLITSDNSQQPEIRHFIDNIKDKIGGYDVVVSSPSLGTGIDITFPENEAKIEGVFGFFDARINTHFDMDQQICRVRHPRFVKVWISQEKFAFEIEPEIIKRNYIAVGMFTDAKIGYDAEGNKTYAEDDTLLSLYAEVISRRHASKNNLREHFIDLKKYNGWIVSEVETFDADAVIGRDASNEAKKEIEREYIEMICFAEKISENEMKKLRNAVVQSPLEQAKLSRYWIETFYGETVTPELVTLDDHGKYRRKVRMMEIFYGHDLHAMDKDMAQVGNVASDRTHAFAKKRLLHDLFASAGLIDDDGEFIVGKRVCSDDLDAFIRICNDRKHAIQDLLKRSLRTDLGKKPVAQLGEFLKLIGCTWATPTKTDIDGRRVVYYQVDMFDFKQAYDYARKRLTRRGSPVFSDWDAEEDDTILRFKRNGKPVRRT